MNIMKAIVLFILSASCSFSFSSVIVLDAINPICNDGKNHGLCRDIKVINLSVKAPSARQASIYSDASGIFAEVLVSNGRYDKGIMFVNHEENIPCDGCIGIDFILRFDEEKKLYSLISGHIGYINSSFYFLGHYSDIDSARECVKREIVDFLSNVFSVGFHSVFRCLERTQINN